VDHDLSTPQGRRDALQAMDWNQPAEHHETLRRMFAAETQLRRDQFAGRAEYTGDDLYENLYLAAFLLYRVGDLSDALLLADAKFRTDWDTRIGFDVQFLLGAGAPETLDLLRAQGDANDVRYIEECIEAGDADDLPGWERFRLAYFRGG